MFTSQLIIVSPLEASYSLVGGYDQLMMTQLLVELTLTRGVLPKLHVKETSLDTHAQAVFIGGSLFDISALYF